MKAPVLPSWRKWSVLELLTELNRGNKVSWQRERERNGRQKGISIHHKEQIKAGILRIPPPLFMQQQKSAIQHKGIEKQPSRRENCKQTVTTRQNGAELTLQLEVFFYTSFMNSNKPVTITFSLSIRQVLFFAKICTAKVTNGISSFLSRRSSFSYNPIPPP